MSDDPAARVRAAVAGAPASPPLPPAKVPSPPLLEQTAIAVAAALELDPQHVGVAIAAGLRSAWITTVAVAAALVLGAAAAGQLGSPRALVAFAAANWWVATTGVITAAIRTHLAYRSAAR